MDTGKALEGWRALVSVAVAIRALASTVKAGCGGIDLHWPGAVLLHGCSSGARSE